MLLIFSAFDSFLEVLSKSKEKLQNYYNPGAFILSNELQQLCCQVNYLTLKRTKSAARLNSQKHVKVFIDDGFLGNEQSVSEEDEIDVRRFQDRICEELDFYQKFEANMSFNVDSFELERAPQTLELSSQSDSE